MKNRATLRDVRAAMRNLDRAEKPKKLWAKDPELAPLDLGERLVALLEAKTNLRGGPLKGPRIVAAWLEARERFRSISNKIRAEVLKATSTPLIGGPR